MHALSASHLDEDERAAKRRIAGILEAINSYLGPIPMDRVPVLMASDISEILSATSYEPIDHGQSEPEQVPPVTEQAVQSMIERHDEKRSGELSRVIIAIASCTLLAFALKSCFQ